MSHKIINMFIRLLLCLIGLSISFNAFARDLIPFPCVLQLAKSNCWKGFQVNVQPVDVNTGQPVGTPIVLDKDTFNTMAPIVGCQPLENLSFQATFTPAVWANSGDAVYPTNQFWQAPDVLPPKANKWIISICFANDFSAVPLPLQAGSSCECTFPAIDNAVTSVSEATLQQKQY